MALPNNTLTAAITRPAKMLANRDFAPALVTSAVAEKEPPAGIP